MKSSKINLPFIVKKLSDTEIKMLRKRMISVWIVGILMAVIASVIIFSDTANFEEMKIPILVFSVFFYSVLLFIIVVHTRNTFQTETKVYTGTITDKRTENFVTRNNKSRQPDLYIALDDNWFTVTHQFFDRVKTGDNAQIFTLRKNQVFKVEVNNARAEFTVPKQDAFEIKSKAYSTFSPVNEIFNETEKSKIKSIFLNLLLKRTIFGLVVFYILFYILNFLVIIFFSALNLGLWALIYAHYLIWILVIAGYFWYNRKTYNVFLDMRMGEKEVLNEAIIDLISSNQIMLKPNSTLMIGYNNSGNYFYMQTEHHWLSLSEAQFKSTSVGKYVLISRTVKSKIVFGFEIRN